MFGDYGYRWWQWVATVLGVPLLWACLVSI